MLAAGSAIRGCCEAESRNDLGAAVRRYPVRFTIRVLMIAIMAVGVALAILREWRGFLPFALFALVSFGGLVAIRHRLHRRRPGDTRSLPAC